MAGALPSGAVVANHGAAALVAKQKYLTFIQLVAGGTGIDPKVLAAWTAAEGGPVDNPLNLRPGVHYGTQKAAADATTKTLLTNPAYAPVLRATTTGTSATLDAIANSPWDAGHYRGTTKKNGSLLRQVYAEAFGVPTTPAPSIPNPFDIGGAISGAENWIADKALTGLLYFALTGLALALLVLGLARATGVSVGGIASTRMPTRKQDAATAGSIPF